VRLIDAVGLASVIRVAVDISEKRGPSTSLRAALAWCATPTRNAEAGLRLVGTLAFFLSVRGYLREGSDWNRTHACRRAWHTIIHGARDVP